MKSKLTLKDIAAPKMSKDAKEAFYKALKGAKRDQDKVLKQAARM